MKKMKNSQTVSELDACQTAVANAIKDAEILGILTEHGYNVTALRAGSTLFTTAVDLSNDGVAHSGARKDATMEVRRTRASLRKAVGRFSGVCRTVFRGNEGVLVKLGLKGQGPMPQSDAAFIDRARILFNLREVSNPDLAKLVARKYDSSKLSQERGKIAAFESARQNAAPADGAEQQGTQDRKSAVRVAKLWFSDFRATARTELGEKPQLLEKLGIVVHDGRTKAQREGVKKSLATRAANRAAKAQQKKVA